MGPRLRGDDGVCDFHLRGWASGPCKLSPKLRHSREDGNPSGMGPRRPGLEAILAPRRFNREEVFRKPAFQYERTRYLYENNEGHVKNEAKTKLIRAGFRLR